MAFAPFLLMLIEIAGVLLIGGVVVWFWANKPLEDHGEPVFTPRFK